MHSYQQKEGLSRKMVGRVDGVPGVRNEEAVKEGKGTEGGEEG